MREISKHVPRPAREGYRRPGGPAPADKVSPLRGKRQRWTFEGYLLNFRTRGDAMAVRRRLGIKSGPKRVFV